MCLTCYIRCFQWSYDARDPKLISADFYSPTEAGPFSASKMHCLSPEFFSRSPWSESESSYWMQDLQKEKCPVFTQGKISFILMGVGGYLYLGQDSHNAVIWECSVMHFFRASRSKSRIFVPGYEFSSHSTALKFQCAFGSWDYSFFPREIWNVFGSWCWTIAFLFLFSPVSTPCQLRSYRN